MRWRDGINPSKSKGVHQQGNFIRARNTTADTRFAIYSFPSFDIFYLTYVAISFGFSFALTAWDHAANSPVAFASIHPVSAVDLIHVAKPPRPSELADDFSSWDFIAYPADALLAVDPVSAVAWSDASSAPIPARASKLLVAEVPSAVVQATEPVARNSTGNLRTERRMKEGH